MAINAEVAPLGRILSVSKPFNQFKVYKLRHLKYIPYFVLETCQSLIFIAINYSCYVPVFLMYIYNNENYVYLKKLTTKREIT